MPPKNKFTKEQIIDAAFDIARHDGIDSITIRKVAEKMGSSIAPIYVNFTHLDELKKEVVKKTFAVSHQLLAETNTGDPFHDIGVVSLRFAKEYSVLFRDLVLVKNQYVPDFQEDTDKLIELMRKDENLTGFSTEELQDLLFKMRVFQLGLSAMVANGLLSEEYTEERLINILDQMATDIILAKQSHNQKT
ncbi:TetR/AcrR family transcriptional regulator [Caldalkalibacillus mannanilyticus]|uniref:TetR/AcrR family transcriptional regulator n=1 Tax=Caldalkalibacillus mannanilyticus TaxID=1418 RepID=UPI0004688682|nr:TetR/AcrR family transcriptional regulator [Caldalkalibacillus mannanilyticus]